MSNEVLEFKFGVVAWFGTKGESFGYIRGDDGIECYVHYSHISPQNQENPKYKILNPGDRVRYVVVSGYLNKGTQADMVEKV